MPRWTPGSGHPAAASPQSACRVLRTARRGRHGPQTTPSRSRRPLEEQPRCVSGDRPTRARLRYQHRPARRGVPALRAIARVRPTTGARLPWSHPATDCQRLRGHRTGTGATTPAAEHRPSGLGDRAPRSPLPHQRCADPSAGDGAPAAMAAPAAYRPARQPACLHCRQSDRPRGSAAGAAKARRRLGTRRRAPSAPQRRTARCGANCRPSNARRTPALRAGRKASPNSRESQELSDSGRPAQLSTRRGSDPPAANAKPRRRPPPAPARLAAPICRPACAPTRCLRRSRWTAARSPRRPPHRRCLERSIPTAQLRQATPPTPSPRNRRSSPSVLIVGR
ncbi:predicted protein [Mycobacterium tuberculosis T17]|nr:predicted protein [Mycobacterium tuberculosis T17]